MVLVTIIPLGAITPTTKISLWLSRKMQMKVDFHFNMSRCRVYVQCVLILHVLDVD